MHASRHPERVPRELYEMQDSSRGLWS